MIRFFFELSAACFLGWMIGVTIAILATVLDMNYGAKNSAKEQLDFYRKTRGK